MVGDLVNVGVSELSEWCVKWWVKWLVKWWVEWWVKWWVKWLVKCLGNFSFLRCTFSSDCSWLYFIHISFCTVYNGAFYVMGLFHVSVIHCIFYVLLYEYLFIFFLSSFILFYVVFSFFVSFCRLHYVGYNNL